MKAELIDRLGDERLLAIVRADDPDAAAAIADGLVQAGIRIAEVSLASPGGLEAIERLAAAHGGALLLGAGTVRTTQDARAALDAGARFLVSPGCNAEIQAYAGACGVVHIPGVMTPTEVDAALHGGADLLKLFPAGRLGPAYVADLLGPFPGARFVATGGIDVDNARAFIDAGAFAVAIGGALVPDGDGGSPALVAQRATRLASLIPRPVKEPHGN